MVDHKDSPLWEERPQDTGVRPRGARMGDAAKCSYLGQHSLASLTAVSGQRSSVVTVTVLLICLGIGFIGT